MTIERPGASPNSLASASEANFETGAVRVGADRIIINLGPQHPSTHGVFRLVLELEGETIMGAQSVMGYLHRGTEKICEEGTYLQNVTLTDRLDYLAGMSNNMAYSMAVEAAGGITVPERGEYIRVLFAELQRYASHCVAVGTFGSDVGTYFTPLLFTFREREAILDLFELACGARMTFTFIRPGGAALELPEEFFPACERLLDDLPRKVDEYEELLTKNEIFLARTKGVGVLPAKDAIGWGVSGPVLRASGVPYDLRRDVPYSAYPEFDFNVVTQTQGDAYARYLARIAEMRESIKIARQALKKVRETRGPSSNKLGWSYRLPPGEGFSRIEAPRGELGFYVVSDGGIAPYRSKCRAPSFINIGPLAGMLKGWKVADVIVILGSIDIVLGEVDR
ncbi:MAG: NADH-quinone oxidoreductase subunit D [Chloroflexota bacterium]|nr:MAG: NADH-quinone oxidoreductase subunit D [Chloroflexota bacterium]